MELPEGTKIRVSYIEDLSKSEVVSINVDSVETAKTILKTHAANFEYQSDPYPIPGMKRLAAIEFLDADGEWSFYEE